MTPRCPPLTPELTPCRPRDDPPLVCAAPPPPTSTPTPCRPHAAPSRPRSLGPRPPAHQRVPLHVLAPRELLAADVAGVGPLARVGAHVPLEDALVHGREAAVRAAELLPDHRELVHCKTARLRAPPPAPRPRSRRPFSGPGLRGCQAAPACWERARLPSARLPPGPGHATSTRGVRGRARGRAKPALRPPAPHAQRASVPTTLARFQE